MPTRPFDAELATLEQLREAPPSTTESPLRKALTNKNNFIVAKAAKLTALHDHKSLIPTLLEAFARFLQNPIKTDPQCWAKNAVAETLAAFDYQEPDFFLAGLQTFQLEGSWGGTTDTAGTLRGISALALVNCRGLSSHQVLLYLVPLFTDKELPVRINTARAIEQLGTDSATLLLRLRAELGSDSPELLGACYSGVLNLEGPAALPWAAKFLRPHAPDDTSTEAAFAIAETRTEPAFNLLKLTYTQTRDPDFLESLLTAIALTRQPAAIDYLFTLIAEGSRPAREALENSGPSQSTLDRLSASRV